MTLRLLHRCVLRSRCPCCGEGRLFAGWLRFREHCAVCGLVYDQWVGEWITPTYLASTVGMLVAVGLMAWMLATGRGMQGPVPPEIAVALASAAAALLALRPCKGGWLAFLYGVGAVEVSARTRARLRWEGAPPDAPAKRERVSAAERRAQSAAPAPAPAPTVRRFASLRTLLLPDRRRPRPPGMSPSAHRRATHR